MHVWWVVDVLHREIPGCFIFLLTGLFNACQEMLQDLLAYILPACRAGLEDPDDDVRAVAAEALIPIASAIVSLDGEALHSIVMLLWDILLDLDDLSPSTSRYAFSCIFSKIILERILPY